MRLLVVDEMWLASSLEIGLEAEEFGVDVAYNGAEGLWLSREHTDDAIVVDMDTSADDYLTKPFSLPVLVARRAWRGQAEIEFTALEFPLPASLTRNMAPCPNESCIHTRTARPGRTSARLLAVTVVAGIETAGSGLVVVIDIRGLGVDAGLGARCVLGRLAVFVLGTRVRLGLLAFGCFLALGFVRALILGRGLRGRRGFAPISGYGDAGRAETEERDRHRGDDDFSSELQHVWSSCVRDGRSVSRTTLLAVG
jgi:CheY-like chemotaxis protein